MVDGALIAGPGPDCRPERRAPATAWLAVHVFSLRNCFGQASGCVLMTKCDSDNIEKLPEPAVARSGPPRVANDLGSTGRQTHRLWFAGRGCLLASRQAPAGSK
jgi:hypothetical protein